jgi:hypothetical protein
VFGGEDRIVASMYVSWRSDAWGPLVATLERAKSSARNGEGEEALVELGGATYQVMASGVRPEGGGPVYAFVLCRGGVRFSISKNQEAKGDMPNVLLDVGSMPLMRCGDAVRLMDDLRDSLEDMGCKIRKTKLSRVDMCTDHTGFHVSKLVDLLRARCFKARGRNREVYEADCPVTEYASGRKITGFVIGKRVMVRAYDKLEETKRDEAKRAMLVDKRWGGETPEHATRIEIQLRREKLRELGVDTWEDYVQKRSEIVGYVVASWLVFTEEPVDPNHTDRVVIHPLWRKVQRTFLACFRGFANLRQQTKPTTKVPPVKLVNAGLRKQTIGCLLSILVGQSKKKVHTLHDWVDELCSLLAEAVSECEIEYLERKFGLKRSRFVGRMPGAG